MLLELTGRHIEITPALRRLVTARIGKLERLLNDSAVSAHVVLVREKHRRVTEVTVHARGDHMLHAVADAASWEASLTQALARVAQQALKVKGKWEGRKRRTGTRRPLELAERTAQVVGIRSGRGPAQPRPRMPRVLQASRQAIKPMSVAEAAREIDGHRDGIVVFMDPSTAAINVLYRGQTGELALVEIEP